MHQPLRRSFPLFRYHPFPVYTGSITAGAVTCPVCGLPCEYSYHIDGPGLGADEGEALRVCPWCLHDGSAARRFAGITFVTAPRAPDVPVEAREELEHRTPTYFAFQEQEWPAHHGDFCAFMGYVGWKEIHPYAAELAADLARLRRQLRWVKADLESWISGSSVQGYLFRCLTCGTHRLTFDQD